MKIYLSSKGLSPTKDNAPIINKTIDGAKEGSCIAFPDGVFPINSPIIQNKRIHWEGSEDTTILAKMSLGIKINTDRCHFMDINVRGNMGGVSEGINDDVKHGVWISGNGNRIERFQVRNFDGDGFFIAGDVNHTPPTNANLNILSDCESYGNGRAGFHLKGGDANQCKLTNHNSQSNARFGIWDESFLGNTHDNGHTAANGGLHNYNKTLITHNGKMYWCIKTNTGIEPEVHSGWKSYWEEFSMSSPFKTEWDNTTEWLSGAGWNLDGPNQMGTFTNCYTEGDEYPCLGGSTSILLNGFLGSRAHSQVYLITRNGTLTARDFQVENNDDEVFTMMYGRGYNTLGWFDLKTGNIHGFKYNPINKTVSFSSKNGGGETVFFTSDTDPTLIGRDTMPFGAIGVREIFFYNESTGKYEGWRPDK